MINSARDGSAAFCLYLLSSDISLSVINIRGIVLDSTLFSVFLFFSFSGKTAGQTQARHRAATGETQGRRGRDTGQPQNEHKADRSETHLKMRFLNCLPCIAQLLIRPASLNSLGDIPSDRVNASEKLPAL